MGDKPHDTALARRFAEKHGAADARALAAPLAALLAAARRAWPDVTLDDGVFVDALAARLGGAADLPEALASPHLVDLYLALGCACGDAGSLKTFQERFLAKTHLYLSKMRLEPGVDEEVQAMLSLKLLVGETGRAPRIAEFGGRGPLDGWVRVAAIRTAVSLVRRKKPEEALAREAVIPGRDSDPELEIIKQRHREDFQIAFEEALRGLEPRDRNLLRLRFAEGLGVHQMTTVYGVHRATIGRWLLDAQDAVLTATRRILRERLKLTESECDSLLGFVRSHLEVTLQGLIRTQR